MENIGILENLGKIAGLAGIVIGAIVLIFGSIIQKNIFPNLTKEHGFRIIRMMIVAASLLAVLGIGVWAYSQSVNPEGFVSKNLIGTVQNAKGQALKNIKVYVLQSREIEDRTDSDGKFLLQLSGNGTSHYDIIFEHSQFEEVRKKIEVNFDDDSQKPELNNVMLMSINSSDSVEPKVVVNPNGGRTEKEIDEPAQSASKATTNITLKYMGDNYGCRINVNITVGGRFINPQSATVVLTNVPLGDQLYSIEGTVFCNNGSCNTSGSDILNITPNATYYIMWLNENGDEHCDIGLLNEEQYIQVNKAY